MFTDFSQSTFCRHLLLLAFYLPFFSCQSDGQNNQDESDYSHRRKIPEHILEALPSSTDTLGKSDYFVFLGHGKIEKLFVDSLDKKSMKLANLLLKYNPSKKTIPTIYWHLYPSSEIKGLMLKNSSPIHVVKEKNEIHLVADSIFNFNYVSEGFPLFIQHVFGKAPAFQIEHGLAILNDSTWQKYGHHKWRIKLAAADAFPSIAEIFDNKNWEYSSPLIYGTASTCMVDFFIEKYGTDFFFEKYTTWAPTENELTDLENEWQQYIGRLKKEYKPEINFSKKTPYIKGFNFAHEGYRIYNGYGSRKAQQSLIYQKKMGANAIAMVPYTFMNDGKKPSPIPIINRAGMENDESVITSSEHAQNLGLYIVLKPQIWLGGGQWPGDIEMNSEDEWGSFFQHYRHWVSHYAMLAEIYDWEAFCVGTEMVQTTLKREKDWEKLFGDIRKIYQGQLTYAANWGEEFEKTNIWDKLDFIGINCYYPLSQNDEPSDHELELAFEEVMEKIKKVHQKYDKPVVFTEIGFPSIKAPWKKPHEDWGDFEVNEDHQARCYEIVFKCLKNKDWCQGILWWKYPSDLDYRYPVHRNTGFTPHTKLAERTVEKWFKHKAE